jgi:hypothetical protein
VSFSFPPHVLTLSDWALGSSSNGSNTGRIGAIVGGTVGGLVGLVVLGAVGAVAWHTFIRDVPLLTRMGMAGPSRKTTQPGRGSNSNNAQRERCSRSTFAPPHTEPSHQSLPYSLFFSSLRIDDDGEERRLGSSTAQVRPISQVYVDHVDLPYSPITEHSSVPPTPSTATPLMVYPPSPSRPLDAALEYTPYVRNNSLNSPPESKCLGQGPSIIGCELTENAPSCTCVFLPYSPVALRLLLPTFSYHILGALVSILLAYIPSLFSFWCYTGIS